MNEQDISLRVPLITAFLQPYPAHLYPDAISEEVNQATSLDELQAALHRSPPTSCSTPGKTRAGGFNKNGKYLPAKFIPGKIDKRAGQ
jgi:hypothetical protein